VTIRKLHPKTSAERSREYRERRKAGIAAEIGRLVHDLTGQTFGRLRVLERAENSRTGAVRWLCECSCGTRKIVVSYSLSHGLSRSCGCLRREEFVRRSTVHGRNGTPEYQSFKSAKNRCRNPNNPAYANYGGRGIRFLFKSFDEFFADLGPRPPGATLERCDNDGHYEPGNCRWANRTEQNNNKRRNRFLTAFGRTRTLARWQMRLASMRNVCGLGLNTAGAQKTR
jgi:hypothetical protein